jgi:hypothetical protein
MGPMAFTVEFPADFPIQFWESGKGDLPNFHRVYHHVSHLNDNWVYSSFGQTQIVWPIGLSSHDVTLWRWKSGVGSKNHRGQVGGGLSSAQSPGWEMRIKLRPLFSVLRPDSFSASPHLCFFVRPPWIFGSADPPGPYQPTVITKSPYFDLIFFPIGVMTIHWSLSHLWTNQQKRPYRSIIWSIHITFMAFVNHKLLTHLPKPRFNQIDGWFKPHLPWSKLVLLYGVLSSHYQ